MADGFGTLKAAVERNKFSEEVVVTNYGSPACDEDNEFEYPSISIEPLKTDEMNDTEKTKHSHKNTKKKPRVQITRSSTLRKIHDVETAELEFESDSDDNETNL